LLATYSSISKSKIKTANVSVLLFFEKKKLRRYEQKKCRTINR